jgi:hypothetical protein
LPLHLTTKVNYVNVLLITSKAELNGQKIWRRKMRYSMILLVVFWGMSVSLPAYAVKGNEKSAYVSLDNIDAVQAMEIANQWKWTRKEVKSYVTPQGVIFIFPDKRVKGIPLPKDKMVVAVAPYINQTHR